MPSIALLCHLYYNDSLEGLLPYLKNLIPYNTRFFFNLCCDTTYYQDIRKDLVHHFENPVITCSPNVGKDIGGKLVILDACLKLHYKCDYMVWLHDKKSPHTTTGNAWREKLLGILEQHNIPQILAEFERQPEIGLIGSKAMLLNEFDTKTQEYACTSNRELQLLRNEYGIRPDVHHFIGGTMFWSRASSVITFFGRHSPLAVRATLEKGNVLDHQQGSMAHAWERMLSWVVLNQGLQIKGI